nr:MAG TPA: hypothetical protein [Caudoviricetes sp.]
MSLDSSSVVGGLFQGNQEPLAGQSAPRNTNVIDIT